MPLSRLNSMWCALLIGTAWPWVFDLLDPKLPDEANFYGACVLQRHILLLNPETNADFFQALPPQLLGAVLRCREKARFVRRQLCVALVTLVLCAPSGSLDNALAAILSDVPSDDVLLQLDLVTTFAQEHVIAATQSEASFEAGVEALVAIVTHRDASTGAQVLQMFYACTNAPGQACIDEDCSRLTLKSWYALIEHVVGLPSDERRKYRTLLAPLLQALLIALRNKMMYPDSIYQLDPETEADIEGISPPSRSPFDDSTYRSACEALRELATECRQQLAPFLDSIIKRRREATQAGLSTTSRQQVIEALTLIARALPTPDLAATWLNRCYADEFVNLTRVAEELQVVGDEGWDLQSRAAAELRVIGHGFRSLIVQGDVLGKMLEALWPIVHQVASTCYQNEEVTSAIRDLLGHALRVAKMQLEPLLPSFCMTLQSMFEAAPSAPVLEAMVALQAVFGRQQSAIPTLVATFADVRGRMAQLFSSGAFLDEPGVVCTFFSLASKFYRTEGEHLLQSPDAADHLHNIALWCLSALKLNEMTTVAAACQCLAVLIELVCQRADLQQAVLVSSNLAHQIIETAVTAITSEVARANVTHVGAILWALQQNCSALLHPLLMHTAQQHERIMQQAAAREILETMISETSSKGRFIQAVEQLAISCR
ncbi:uncharacterized protein MONBRDRAFT_32455 [Monosiga brevicollis MX1]|uniref:Exportin-1/Importin-beta-like domain-containing protein n=1 Tax=Monosiga brevicollis TaxID=81824 RepID=A9UZL5_MONBE|nr:uncharacterized protein MONBRDRAFT_32455 [Monosiga brevicollis MX1]EDQ89390.1 predicted protein [Monosiga brevicollis MX1]|eukprot:XP_001745966.1 hypothetical protein [Monosiga brevicollis MX1]